MINAMRIVLADDAALLRAGLAALLTGAGHDIVAEAADAEQLRSTVEKLGATGELPDIVVTDVRMPPHNADDGLQATLELRREFPGLPVIVLSAYVAGRYVQDLLDSESGAVGYLLKERVGRVSDFLGSLDLVAAGGVVVDPEVVSHLMRANTAGASSGPLARLTTREREVLALMAEGLSNSQIAERLVVSSGAVAKHVANIFQKLDLAPSEENRRVRAVLAWLQRE